MATLICALPTTVPRTLLRLAWRLTLGVIMAHCALANAQPAPQLDESALKAGFLFKFGGFVEWPAGTFMRPDQPLVIAVSGDDEVAAELGKLFDGRTVEGRPVEMRRLPEAVAGAALAGVHVLFLGARPEARLREALEAAAGPMLVVTEQPGALRLGSVLNFSSEEGRVRFAASLTSAEARNLKLSARLLALAQEIEGRPR